MIPILIFGFCIKPHLAIDAELLSTVSTKLVGTVGLARHRLIDWRVLGQVALVSVPACLLSLYVTRQLATSFMKKTSDRIIRSVLLAYAGLKLIAF